MKPPLRCPCCGDLPAELVKRWERQALPSGRVLRYPASVRATYHCGATVEARYVIKGSIGGPTRGAFWQLVSTSGCTNAVTSALGRRR